MSATLLAIGHIVLALVGAPLLLGIINRTKAVFAGRRGQPVLQPYFDILKLMRKGAVYSSTTTWIFRAGPAVTLAAVLTGLCIVPFAGAKPLLAFQGDLILIAYLLALSRLMTVLAAIDTGSSFEGMGASRELTFSMLAEPALFVGLLALARVTHSLSLDGILYKTGVTGWSIGAPALVAAALFVVFLTENARLPIDDPDTHLELTMIHEVMVLDHGGPDLGLVQCGSALKLWLLGILIVGVASPNLADASLWLREGFAVAGLAALAVLVGIVESFMARMRLMKVPQLLIGAGALSVLAAILVLG
ncbi:MAG TPA: NADH-quinone oxidoreductase subunit H [bacterium]|nr:NADH-quinone oxidoreductase subunit H [bacterium]